MKTILHSKKRVRTLKKKPALLQVCLVLFSFVIIHKAQSQNCTVNSGLSQQVCTTTATLNGNINGIAVGNPTWTFISGPATPVIVTPNSLTSNVTGMTLPGNYVFQIAQACQAGGTVTQQVTIIANPQPAFTAGTGFIECGNYGSVKTLSATLPAGWTGRWKVLDGVYGGDNTSIFIFSDITSPTSTVQLIPARQTCGNQHWIFVWEVTSPNGLCKYSKTVTGKWNPDISLLNYELGGPNKIKCGNDNMQFSPLPGFCGFWQIFHQDYVFTVVPISVPAGFTGTLSVFTNGSNQLVIGGASVPGTYVVTVNLTSPCGNKTFGPLTFVVLPARPTSSGVASVDAFCIKSPPASYTYTFTVSDSTVISAIVEIWRPPGADPVIATETGAGTNTRTITITPNTNWKPGGYRIIYELRNAVDTTRLCTASGWFPIHIFDSLGTSLKVQNSNHCIPVGSTSMNVTITLPPNPTTYITNTPFPGGIQWRLTKISGPASGSAIYVTSSAPTTTFIGLTAGLYKYKIEAQPGALADEMACSNGPFVDSFTINVYNPAGANAGSNQNVLCVNNFALAANIPTSPSFGTWSQVLGPTPLTFTDIHDPNARAGNPGITLPGDYVFRWTVTDPNGACATVSSDVTINSLTVCTPLPVSLLSFSAQKLQDKTFIQWTTVTEQYSKAFVVEWSTNGQSWQALGTVAAAGNSNIPVNYSFVHNTPVKGINYYRLKQVDLDSRHTYSRIAAVRFDNSVVVSIFPNPVRDNLYLNNTKPGDLIKIIAGDGKVMLNRKVLGENETVDMSHYANGFYILHIINGETGINSAFKVTKQ